MNIIHFAKAVEAMGFTWDIGWRGRADLEVRVWDFPKVVVRQSCNVSDDLDWAMDIILNKLRASSNK